MSVNLVKLAYGYLSNSEVSKVSEFLGEDSEAVSKGLAGALPIILGGIMSQSSTKEGLGSLMGLVNLGMNSGVLDNLDGLLSNKSQSQGLLNNGSGLVSSILGNKASATADAIASFSGLKKTSSSSLLSIVAPLLMSVIGKQVKSDGLNLSELANMLMGQKEHVKEAMPKGMASVSNFDKIAASKGGLSEGKSGLSLGKSTWLVYLVPILVVLVAIWAFRGCSGNVSGSRVTDESINGQ